MKLRNLFLVLAGASMALVGATPPAVAAPPAEPDMIPMITGGDHAP